MNKYIILNLTVSLVLLCSHLNAQRNPYFDYSEFRSIPSKSILNATQDKDGRMWFVTQQGVMSYNGYEWKMYQDTLGLPVFEESQLISLENGGIALAGVNPSLETVAATFQDNKWTIRSISKEASVYNKYFIDEYENKLNIYSITNDSLVVYEFKTSKISKIELPEKLKRFNLFKIKRYKEDIVILSNNGVYSFNGNDFLPYKFETNTGINDGILYDFYLNKSKDTLISVGKKEINITVGNKLIKSTTNTEINQQVFDYFSTIILKDNKVYYSASSPLFLIDLNRNIERKVIGHGDRTINIWTKVYLDRQNNLWLCNTRGISKINSLAFHNYDSDENLIEDEVSTILHLPNDFHFIGQNRGFVVMHKLDSFYWKYPLQNKLFSRIQDAVAISDHEILAAASYSGLLKIDIKNKTVEKQNWAGDFVSCVNIRNDTVWVCDVGSYKIFKNKSILSETNHDAVRRIDINKNGELNLLTRYGLFNLDKDVSYYENKSTSPEKNVYFMHEYKEKQLIGSIAGLLELKNDEFIPYEINGFNEKFAVYSIEVDHDDHLWLGTSDGVYEITGNQVFNRFDVSSGMIGNEVNRMALSVDNNNNIWVGTDEGMTIIDKNYLHQFSPAPKPYIDAAFARSREISLEKDQIISFNENDLDIVFGAYTFIDEQIIEYRYKLEGLDENWTYLTAPAQYTQRYNYLLPGKYTFVFQARESGTPWSEVYESEQIEIKNPFYYEVWFIVLTIISFSIFLYIIFRLIMYKRLQNLLQFKLNEKMQEVNLFQQKLIERNQELEKLNTEQDTLVYSISHDLRGPIKSTQGLINLYNNENNLREKDHYVSLMNMSMNRLDKFIGNILDISRNSRLEIQQQPVNLQELMQGIIDGHKYRPEAEDINFIVNCQNHIIYSDPGRLTMIFNNLISNAIIYSKPYEANKIVKVECIKTEDSFVITVWDNGVGIHHNYLNKVFKIFSRANETKSGSGLGLYIARQTAEKLNGRLELNSVFGKWTEFTLILKNNL